MTSVINPTGSDDFKGVMSNEEQYARLPTTPKPVVCEFCGRELYTRGFTLGHRIVWHPFPESCTCRGAKAARAKAEAEQQAQEQAKRQDEEARRLQEKVKRIVGESGMGERFLRRTFQTLEITDTNRRAAAAARRYAEGFEQLLPKRDTPEPGRNGLFISGPPGTGKTHLAASISNYLLSQGRPVICMTMIDLLERIKETYAKGETDTANVLKIYKTVPLLVIDDMGKEPPTEWAISTIYNIINGRYEAYLPIIVTTNYDTNALISRMTPRETKDDTTARTIIDRLKEMCRGITLTGESWRGR